MTAILLVGNKGEGKDTAAEHLVRRTLYHWDSLASPIKDVGNVLFGWGYDYAEGELKETVDPVFGMTPRKFYQIFGTEVMQKYLPSKIPGFKKSMGRFLWVKLLCMRCGNQNIVVSDCRFPHEVSEMKNHFDNVIVVRVRRHKNKSFWTKFFSHSSEKELDKIKPDWVVYNDSTKEELYSALDRILLIEGVIDYHGLLQSKPI